MQNACNTLLFQLIVLNTRDTYKGIKGFQCFIFMWEINSFFEVKVDLQSKDQHNAALGHGWSQSPFHTQSIQT